MNNEHLVDLIGNYSADIGIETDTITKVLIYFDGGCSPTNPGNAYGSYEVMCKTVPEMNHKQTRQRFGIGTSNQAEYLSLIAALKWLRHKTDGEGILLKIFSDSKLVVMQVQGSWKSKDLKMRELRDEARTLLKHYRAWTIHWHQRAHNVQRFGH